MAKSETLRRRGKNAKITGERWEREFIRDFRKATGIELQRQLKERRDGNLGDIEVHPQVPLVFQCRKRREVSVFSALEDAREAAKYHGVEETHSPVGVVQKRVGRELPGVPNPRGIAMYQDDWLELLETFLADKTQNPPGWVGVRRKGSTYPRVWDALDEARHMVQTHFTTVQMVPVGIGVITGDEGANIVLVDYDGWLRVVGELFKRRLW